MDIDKHEGERSRLLNRTITTQVLSAQRLRESYAGAYLSYLVSDVMTIIALRRITCFATFTRLQHPDLLICSVGTEIYQIINASDLNTSEHTDFIEHEGKVAVPVRAWSEFLDKGAL